jgi:hypothetical protein
VCQKNFKIVGLTHSILTKKCFRTLSTSQKHAQNPLKIQGKPHSLSSKKFKTSLLLHGGFALNKKPALSFAKTLLATSAKKIRLKRRTKSP